jgi:hypothetical protein
VLSTNRGFYWSQQHSNEGDLHRQLQDFWLPYHLCTGLREVEVTLRLTVSQYVLVSSTLVGLATRYYFLWECYCLKFAVLFLWGVFSNERTGLRFCSAITQWSESRRTRNHTLLSHLRLPQPGGPGSRIYILQEQGDPVIPAGTGFPLRRLWRLAGLRRRYLTFHPTWRARSPYIYPSGTGWSSPKSKSRYDRRSVSMSWALVHAALQVLQTGLCVMCI